MCLGTHLALYQRKPNQGESMKSASVFDRIPRLFRRGECLVGGMVVLAAALLILPVSPGLMDFLLALNMAGSAL